jgi:competence protein ComEC
MHLTRKEISIILILVIIAVVRFPFFLPDKPPYDKVVGKNVSVEGKVIDIPDIRIYNQRLIIKPNHQESNILAVVPKNLKVSYGDIVRVNGILETPENFTTSSGKEFNYERYLANQDIYFIINNASLDIISHYEGFSLKVLLYKFRNAFMKNISHIILPPQSDLAGGLILGVRGGFDNDIRNEFIATGTIHIIALSGYNVSVVAEGTMKVLGILLSTTASSIFGVIIIILFVILSGASSTAIRAGIMACIILFARITGRTYNAGRALIIAGLLMIAYDSRVLSDISFQLSFIATFGVLYVTPKVIKWVRFLPARFSFRELVATTIAATITVLPILLYSTGILSIVSLPANILILHIYFYFLLQVKLRFRTELCLYPDIRLYGCISK